MKKSGVRHAILHAPTVPAQLAAIRLLVNPNAFSNLAAQIALQTGTSGVADPIVGWMLTSFASKQLRYIPDEKTCGGLRNADLWRGPLETVANGGGDCEDLSILAASALIAFGIPDSWLVVGDLPGGRHAWVEGIDNQSGFLLEATRPSLVRQQRPAQYRPEFSYHPGFEARIFADGEWHPLAVRR